MPNIQPTTSINLEQELGNLEQYKYHPGGIMQVSLNRLYDMLSGKVEILEPSNPFTYLLETSCLNTAFAVQEFTMLSRKLYPRLANTDEDIYLHMSDYDYLGRFSEPSSANVVFNILMNDFTTKAHYDPVRKEHILKLPRHLKVIVGDHVYLSSSAIIIRRTTTGVLDVKFENQDFNNIFPVKTNYINFNTYNVNNEEQYLTFTLALPEVDVEVNDIPIDQSALIKGYFNFSANRKFYFLRAFHRKDDKWHEMLVTHTNEVYDVNTPTCIIKVLPTDSAVEYHIPNIYANTGKIGSNVRILIYTTKGYVSTNFTDFRLSDFTVEYADVFPQEEMDVYTAPIQLITKIVYIKNSVSSGKDGLTFDQLKQAVIDNSIGDRKLPITIKQLEFQARQYNFNIIKDVDIVTDRVYKLETELPTPVTRYPVTKFNLDILEYNTTVSKLRQGNLVKSYGADITVLQEGAIFKIDNGVLTILSSVEADNLKMLTGSQLTTAVNSNTYLSLYFHYVLNTYGDRTTLRAYDINTPSVTQINFKTYNTTTSVGANSIAGNLYKSPTGYTLDILTNFKKFNNAITEQMVKPYLVYTDAAGTKYFLESSYHTKVNDQPVYRFLINTSFYINESSKIGITNFRDSNAAITTVFIDLNAKLEVLYVSSIIPPLFQSTEVDRYVNDTYLYGGKCAVTLEEIEISFGKHLSRFYTAVRTATSAGDYLRYEEDVVMRYDKTVYDSDNEIVHEVGDVVYNPDMSPVIEHTKGSVVIDEYGEPIASNSSELLRFMNLMFIDYRVTLATNKNSTDYAKLIRQHITTVTLTNAQEVQNQLLDNSQAFVVVPKTVGLAKVKTAYSERTINSAQRFVYTILVSYDVFNNSEVRDNITYAVIKTTDEYLHNNRVLKKSQILNSLYVELNEFIISLSIDYFTELDSEYIEVIDRNSRITIEKSLVVEAAGYNLKENVDVVFKLIE